MCSKMSVTELSPVFTVWNLPGELDTPAVVVDLDHFETNVERMATEMRERRIRLRPHTKTHSSTVVARYQTDHGADGVTAGTLRMAAALASAGLSDLFVASPVWPDRAEVSRLRDLHDAVSLTIGIDSAEAAEALGAVVAGARVPLRVLIEIDSGEGRSGVRSDEAAAVARAARAAGLTVGGAFTHGGHAYRGPGRGSAAGDDEVRTLAAAARELTDAGIEVETLSAGSTPTVLQSARPPVNEERPGTYVFNDRQQVHLGGAMPDDIALVVASTVTSTAVPGQVILNCGAKALSKDRPDWLEGFGVLPDYPEAIVTRLFDFHAVVRIPEGTRRPRQGEVVAVVPNHVCPVVNLSRELVVARDGRVVGTWPIDARG